MTCFSLFKQPTVHSPTERRVDGLVRRLKGHATEGSLSGPCGSGSRGPSLPRRHLELEYLRTRFVEFKDRVRDLEEAEDSQLPKMREGVEVAWKDLIGAVETLMAALD